MCHSITLVHLILAVQAQVMGVGTAYPKYLAKRYGNLKLVSNLHHRYSMQPNLICNTEDPTCY